MRSPSLGWGGRRGATHRNGRARRRQTAGLLAALLAAACAVLAVTAPISAASRGRSSRPRRDRSEPSRGGLPSAYETVPVAGGPSSPPRKLPRHGARQRLHLPTPEDPVYVHHILNFTSAGFGGLNNILFGHIRALRLGCRMLNTEAERDGHRSVTAVILPPLRSDVTHRRKQWGYKFLLHEFGDVFDLPRLAAQYRKGGCLISDNKDFAGLIQSGAVRLTGPILYEDPQRNVQLGNIRGSYRGKEQERLYAALAPSKRLNDDYLAPCLNKLRSQFGNSDGYLAVHMRVEDDWVEFMCPGWAPTNPVGLCKSGWQCCFGSDEIARIVMGTGDLSSFRNVLLVYAADRFLNSTVPRHPKLSADPRRVWPRGYRAVSQADLNCFDGHPSYTERSVVSFFLLATADASVGSAQSSMTNGVYVYRSMARRAPTYLYDCPSTGYKAAKAATNRVGRDC